MGVERRKTKLGGDDLGLDVDELEARGRKRGADADQTRREIHRRRAERNARDRPGDHRCRVAEAGRRGDRLPFKLDVILTEAVVELLEERRVAGLAKRRDVGDLVQLLLSAVVEARDELVLDRAQQRVEERAVAGDLGPEGRSHRLEAERIGLLELRVVLDDVGRGSVREPSPGGVCGNGRNISVRGVVKDRNRVQGRIDAALCPSELKIGAGRG